MVEENNNNEAASGTDPNESRTNSDDDLDAHPNDEVPNTDDDGKEKDSVKLILEQDRFLPIANISRLMKMVMPSTGKIAKDAKECIQESVSEFISFLTQEASEKCLQEKRKTITGEDLLTALETLGFDNFVEPLTTYIKKYREANRSERSVEVHNQNTFNSSSSSIPSSSAETSETENTTNGNVVSLHPVPLSFGGEAVSQIIMTGDDSVASSMAMIPGNGVPHMNLLVDPTTGQHYINVQTASGTPQLLPVQLASQVPLVPVSAVASTSVSDGATDGKVDAVGHKHCEYISRSAQEDHYVQNESHSLKATACFEADKDDVHHNSNTYFLQPLQKLVVNPHSSIPVSSNASHEENDHQLNVHSIDLVSNSISQTTHIPQSHAVGLPHYDHYANTQCTSSTSRKRPHRESDDSYLRFNT
ncbi:hypothetical protein AB6A40_004548 [Gnathostoma spinigerum]|uniref:Transcription factor CBF/NF-Y/archaeal histone domain-containing protein n=1 Tax=Gnathostoma spinigerum TaxID=75299 RepID=A0ABD6EKH0_9BILA